jgi:hypothetical protein
MVVDTAQFSAWLVVALLFVVGGVLLSRVDGRLEILAQRWEQFSGWLEALGRTEEEEDELFVQAEMRRLAREERLYADLGRLQHLLATDTYMSATRQLGNRIAYAQLVVEVGSLGRQQRPAPPDHRWAIERTDTVPAGRNSGPETLDIRWR